MFLVTVEMEDMPIINGMWLFQDKFYADRKARELEKEHPYCVFVREITVEDQFYAKPSNIETKLLFWGKEYLTEAEKLEMGVA
jgi:hypothetical protein